MKMAYEARAACGFRMRRGAAGEHRFAVASRINPGQDTFLKCIWEGADAC